MLTSLRFFNVVGSGFPDITDTSPHNLFPLVIKALEEGRTPRINGTDYQTEDGTCVRDYVHVSDLARSHVAAAKLLEQGVSLDRVYNLGSGSGSSVREIIDFDPEIGPRRIGDPDRIVADGAKATEAIAWTNGHTVTEMVKSAWDSRGAGI